jgi:hypothetical protein
MYALSGIHILSDDVSTHQLFCAPAPPPPSAHTSCTSPSLIPWPTPEPRTPAVAADTETLGTLLQRLSSLASELSPALGDQGARELGGLLARVDERAKVLLEQMAGVIGVVEELGTEVKARKESEWELKVSRG